MNFNTVRTMIATGGIVGHYPGGGTLMSLLTLPVIIGIYHYIPSFYSLYLITLIVSGYHIIKAIAVNYIEKDPRIIVIDEAIGMSIACWYIPLQWHYFLLAFILFRFFDILKPLGIHAAEDIGNAAAGIIADDMLAGLYTCIIIQTIRYCFL